MLPHNLILERVFLNRRKADFNGEKKIGTSSWITLVVSVPGVSDFSFGLWSE
jgi:hypothetical protein